MSSSVSERPCPMMGIVAQSGLVVAGLEIAQLLVEVFLDLARQVRVGRGRTVAVGAMAGDANRFGNTLPQAMSALGSACSEAKR